MKRFERLTGASRAMIRRLEEKGDIYASFVQAGSAVKQYEGATFLDLLKPLPPSGDPGLLRVVAKLANEKPVRQGPSLRSQKIPPFHLRKTLQSPRVAMNRPAEGQTLPRLPAGVDPLPAKQIIQRLLDRVGQNMMTGLSDNEICRGSILKTSVSAKEKEAVQSSPTMSGGTEKRKFVFDHRMLTDQNQGLYGQRQTMPDMSDPKRGGADPHQVVSAGQGALPGIAADPGESKEKSWFGTHPKHEQAAATVMTRDQDFQISGDVLKKWAAPRLNESSINPPDASSHRKEYNYESRAVAENRTFTKTGFGAKKISDPAPERPDTAIPQPPLPENQTPSSQLAQLVRKWEDRSRQSTEGHPTDGEPVQNATENGPGPDTAKGHLPLKGTVNESRDAHWIDGHGQTPADPDQLFAMTLERVLKREIRRYGMEQTP